jgi:hypothetical protein
VVRRNHALVRAGARWRQGWDVWLGGKFAGALSSRMLSDLATLSRGELLAVLRPACCGRRREFQDDQPRLPSARQAGGVKWGSICGDLGQFPPVTNNIPGAP